MTDAVNEQLSACLDGELPDAELDLLLKRLERDAELRAAAGRYAILSEALRNEKPAVTSAAFAAKVMAAVEQEPAPARGRIRISAVLARRLRPAAGAAIAASVAALAILSVQRFTVLPQTVAVNDPIATTVSVSQDDSDSYVVPTSTSTTALVPATRLTNYVVAHSEYSSPLGRRLVLTGVLADEDVDPDAADAHGVHAEQADAEQAEPQEH